MDPVPYEKFRTGLTYRDVYLMLWVPSDDRTLWRYKRRGTVLGLWRKIKKDLYDRYLNEQHSVQMEVRLPGNDNDGEQRSAT